MISNSSLFKVYILYYQFTATSLCFAEKQIYTQETVAVVMQHLMEMTPLPTLLMRTVIQSLALYPRLSGFVMNILQRLILKQVWKQPKVWEGFVKCCERTQPQSFAVILQLPPTQLAEALKMASNLRAPLLAHVEAFAENQVYLLLIYFMCLLPVLYFIKSANNLIQK